MAWQFKEVPPLQGTGSNTMFRKVSKTIYGKDTDGNEIKYIVAIFRGCALGSHESQGIRIWYNYSSTTGRYRSSSVVFCALDMEARACEVFEAIKNEDDIQHILASPIILHGGRWW